MLIDRGPGSLPSHPDYHRSPAHSIMEVMGSCELDPVRFIIVYPGVGTSRQLYWNDVLTHIRLRRLSGRPLPDYVVDLERPLLFGR